MNALLAVALNTYREAIRNRVLYVLALFATLLLFAGGFLTQVSFNHEKRVYLDSAAALIDLFSAFLAMGTGVNLIYKELQNKTVYLILTKPISRTRFLAGKLLGLWAVMWVLTISMGILAAGGSAILGVGGLAALSRQVVLSSFQALVLLSISLLFSSFTTPVLTGAFTFGMFLIGRFVPDLHAILHRKFQPDLARDTADRLLDMLPQLHLFAVSGHELQGRYVSIAADFVSWRYVGITSVYSLLYVLLVMALASWMFRRRDLV